MYFSNSKPSAVPVFTRPVLYRVGTFKGFKRVKRDPGFSWREYFLDGGFAETDLPALLGKILDAHRAGNLFRPH